jgi:hypothetical protein
MIFAPRVRQLGLAGVEHRLVGFNTESAMNAWPPRTLCFRASHADISYEIELPAISYSLFDNGNDDRRV